MGTYDDLIAWLQLVQEIAEHWGRLMEENWADLPPDVTRRLLDASRAFADAGEKLLTYINIEEQIHDGYLGQ